MVSRGWLWVVADGFGQFQVVSGGFEWYAVLVATVLNTPLLSLEFK